MGLQEESVVANMETERVQCKDDPFIEPQHRNTYQPICQDPRHNMYVAQGVRVKPFTT
jgi:hypothetical protein